MPHRAGTPALQIVVTPGCPGPSESCRRARTRPALRALPRRQASERRPPRATAPRQPPPPGAGGFVGVRSGGWMFAAWGVFNRLPPTVNPNRPRAAVLPRVAVHRTIASETLRPDPRPGRVKRPLACLTTREVGRIRSGPNAATGSVAVRCEPRIQDVGIPCHGILWRSTIVPH